MDNLTAKTAIMVIVDERISDLRMMGKNKEADIAEEALGIILQIVTTDEPKAPASNMDLRISGFTKSARMCPKCGALVHSNINDGFCGHCGQALKWEG